MCSSVMYIQNVHLKLYLYFSDKLLSKRTAILETFVSRWLVTLLSHMAKTRKWHALLEADRSCKPFHKPTELQQVMTMYNK